MQVPNGIISKWLNDTFFICTRLMLFILLFHLLHTFSYVKYYRIVSTVCVRYIASSMAWCAHVARFVGLALLLPCSRMVLNIRSSTFSSFSYVGKCGSILFQIVVRLKIHFVTNLYKFRPMNKYVYDNSVLCLVSVNNYVPMLLKWK